MAKIAMTWRWLAVAALLLAPVAVFATGEAEQGASTGAGAAMGGRFSEAPMLAARVAAGELPPVEERIPFDPVVQEMLADGVGRYGGTLRVSEAMGFMNQRGGELTTQMLDIYLLTMHQQTLEIVPNIAAGYAVSDDGLTVTLELRPGTRWSNGDPFIVDDLMFVMEDMKWDDRVDPGWRAGETPTTAVSITNIGNYTISLIPGVDVGRAFGFNPTYKEDHYRALFNDVRFRRAMSLALDQGNLMYWADQLWFDR